MSTFSPNTAIFLAKGFYLHPDINSVIDNFCDAGCSETELSDRLMVLVEAVDEAYLINATIYKLSYFEIFSYDISEPMGNYIAEYAIEHNELPSPENVLQESQKRIINNCNPDYLLQALHDLGILFSKHSEGFKVG